MNDHVFLCFPCLQLSPIRSRYRSVQHCSHLVDAAIWIDDGHWSDSAAASRQSKYVVPLGGATLHGWESLFRKSTPQRTAMLQTITVPITDKSSVSMKVSFINDKIYMACFPFYTLINWQQQLLQLIKTYSNTIYSWFFVNTPTNFWEYQLLPLV